MEATLHTMAVPFYLRLCTSMGSLPAQLIRI